jgi:hypothetical protein
MRRRVTISVPDDIQSYIKEMAGQQDMSMSTWLEQMLIEDFRAKGIDLDKPDQGCKSKAAEA